MTHTPNHRADPRSVRDAMLTAAVVDLTRRVRLLAGVCSAGFITLVILAVVGLLW